MTARTFTAEDYAARMRRAAEAAAGSGFAGLLITPGPDLAYFTGYRPPADTERLTMLVIAADRDPVLVVPRLERPDAEHAEGASAIGFADWTDNEDPYAVALRHMGSGDRFGVADNAWAMHLLGLMDAAPEASFAALSKAMPMLRAVKDTDELERIAAAGAAADATYREILEAPFAGRREREVAADLADLLRAHGHEQVDFTIVASGPNGANPHHEAGDRVIGEGDAVVLDFGGLRDGYGSDTTRTVHVGEVVDEEVRRVHDLVREAQQTAFEAVRPGVACQEIDRAARKVIEDGGYGEWFIHRTGHGIGLTTHEPPYMVEGEANELVPGMCFSIEPGVYLPGRFGVRIEDIVTVTEDGGRRYNDTPRELAVVG